jgi:hypothetical protein
MSNESLNSPTVLFSIVREKDQVRDISTTSPFVNHFLDLVKISRPYNTWVSYAQDLKVFFQTIPKLPEAVTRADCLEFMKRQDEAGCSGASWTAFSPATPTLRRMSKSSGLVSESVPSLASRSRGRSVTAKSVMR